MLRIAHHTELIQALSCAMRPCVKPGYRKGRWNLYGWSAQLQDVELEFATPVLMIQCG